MFYKNGLDAKKTMAEETQSGKNVVDAAKIAGVKHFIWSTLEATDTLRIPHWESKHDGERTSYNYT